MNFETSNKLKRETPHGTVGSRKTQKYFLYYRDTCCFPEVDLLFRQTIFGLKT